MNITRKDKMIEAEKRMRFIGLYKPTIRQFTYNKEHYVSLSARPFGGCFWVNDELKEKIKEFEDKYNALVYHVIETPMEFGTVYHFMFVSDHQDEWAMDWDDLKNKRCFVWTYEGQFNEFGTIGFRLGIAAGLLQTA